jgi:Rha family phage regulatory protein
MKKRPTPHEKPSALEPRRHSTAATPLVELDRGEVWTTSLLVANKFGKRHADVLRAVEKLECSPEFSERNFALTSAEVAQPNGGFRAVPMYRITRDGFSFLAMGFTGRAAAAWKEAFIAAFGKMERELRRLTVQKLLPDWQEARQLGKTDRRDLTDAVQALCERAHERGDSTTPLHLWMTAATQDRDGRPVRGSAASASQPFADRLTARQLRRLAMAEECYARAIDSLLDSPTPTTRASQRTGQGRCPGLRCGNRRP